MTTFTLYDLTFFGMFFTIFGYLAYRFYCSFMTTLCAARREYRRVSRDLTAVSRSLCSVESGISELRGLSKKASDYIDHVSVRKEKKKSKKTNWLQLANLGCFGGLVGYIYGYLYEYLIVPTVTNFLPNTRPSTVSKKSKSRTPATSQSPVSFGVEFDIDVDLGTDTATKYACPSYDEMCGHHSTPKAKSPASSGINVDLGSVLGAANALGNVFSTIFPKKQSTGSASSPKSTSAVNLMDLLGSFSGKQATDSSSSQKSTSVASLLDLIGSFSGNQPTSVSATSAPATSAPATSQSVPAAPSGDSVDALLQNLMSGLLNTSGQSKSKLSETESVELGKNLFNAFVQQTSAPTPTKKSSTHGMSKLERKQAKLRRREQRKSQNASTSALPVTTDTTSESQQFPVVSQESNNLTMQDALDMYQQVSSDNVENSANANADTHDLTE